MKNKRLLIDTILVSVSLILIIIAFFLPHDAPVTIAFWFVAFVLGGASKAIEGVQKTIEHRSLNVEFLMIVAAIASFFTANYSEGAILIFIFALSGVLEEYALSRSEKALTSLLKIAPKTAIRILEDETEQVIDIRDLQIGHHVLVKVGQQVPGDGKVFKGFSSLNQAAITGEFVPVLRDVGDPVYAGSINVDAPLIVEITKNPNESVVQKMIDFIATAQAAKSPAESRISTFERWYVYVVIALSITVMVVPGLLGWLPFDESFRRGVIILVVASPCALVASITPAILSSLSNAARHGILLKSGAFFDVVPTIRSIVFDKTGTITKGVPHVVQEVHAEFCERETFESIVKTLEKQSNHPLAKAIVAHLSTANTVDIPTKEVAGRGMEAHYEGTAWRIGRFDYHVSESLATQRVTAMNDGLTIVDVIRGEELVGFYALKDTIRDDVAAVMTDLDSLGIQTMMLTGDNERTAQRIASDVHLTSFQANCMPEDKVKVVQHLLDTTGPVMMVGDGINDAPSLALATLGVAMGDGTDVSLETADIVMMNNNLANLPYLVRLSKRMRRVVLQNTIFSISVIVLLLLSNFWGAIQLPMGVVAHETSTILVILNSLRLLIANR